MTHKKYSKINTVYKRDLKGKILIGEYAEMEFELLKDFTWIGTEKVDGTNTRLIWNGETLEVKGKTDKSEITPYIKKATDKYLDVEKFKDMFGDKEVIIYGESYGKNIQYVGSSYLAEDNDFIIFDVYINGIYLNKENVANVAKGLGAKSVPIVFEGTLLDAIKKVTNGFKSTLADVAAEGLVLVPKGDLRKRNGDRIITKIKCKDIRKAQCL